ncbi:MAG: ArsR/SmtB family transcription factor [Actinomycetota bacterium]
MAATSAAPPTQQLAALADDTRWAILELLGSEPRSASELATALPVSRQAIAKHLAVLEAAGLVDAVREGRSVRHRAIGASLTALADRLDTIGRGWESRLERLARLAEGQHAGAPPSSVEQQRRRRRAHPLVE